VTTTAPLWQARSPLLLGAWFLASFAAVCTGAVVAGASRGVKESTTTLRAHRRLGLVVRSERTFARHLGWGLGTWVALRVGAPVALLIAGVAIHVPALAWCGPVAAVLGLRWALALRATRRQIALETAIVDILPELRDRLSFSSQTLDQALREIAQRATDACAAVLRPLLDDTPMAIRLAAMADLAQSAIVDHIVVALAVARRRDPSSLCRTIEECLVRTASMQVKRQQQGLKLATGQRTAGYIMLGVTTFMFAVLARVDEFQAFFQSMAGTIILLFCGVWFWGMFWILDKMAQVRPWSRFDVSRVMDAEDGRGV